MRFIVLAALFLGAVPQEEKKSDTVTCTVEELLAVAGPRTGLKFVYAEETNVAKRRVTLPAITEKTPREEVFGILETALQACDLVMVPGDGKGVPALIVQASVALKKSVPVLGPNDPIPPGNGMYTKMFKLVALSPRDIHASLINLVSYPQGILAMESAGTVLVTDYASNLRKVAKIIESVDKGQ